MTLVQTLETLCGTFGVTGREDEIASALTEMVSPYVQEVRRDAMGNLIAFRKGQGKGRLMLAAHMDEIGLMVTHIEDNGFLRVCAVGGVSPQRTCYRQVQFENGLRGMVGREEKSVPDISKLTMNHLFVDIGAAGREEAAARVSVGDTARFLSEFMIMDGRAASGAMDNRAACAVVVEALRRLETTPQDVYAVFTTQEEVGLRGARTAAYALEPDVAIALDVTGSGDTPETAVAVNMALGKGPTVKIMDSSVICHPRVVAWLEKAGQAGGITTQREVLPYGGTDTAAIQSSRRGVPAGAISIPCRYIHSQAETIDLGDLEGAADLLVKAMTLGYEV